MSHSSCLTLVGRWSVLAALLAAVYPAAIGAQEQSSDKGAQKYVRFHVGDEVSYGIVEGDSVRRIEGDLFASEWEKSDKTFPLDEVQLLVPTVPTKVLALAGNYKSHLGDEPLPKNPEPFFKPLSSLQHHNGDVHQPEDGQPVHHEAELVIVIGRQASHVSKEEAMDYVFGVTCGNDISERNWQKNDVQWWRAKGSDTFGPVGPYIATGLDYDNLDIEMRINGEVRQKANTRELIFGIADTVSFISHYVTLEPGDLIFTGTPGETTAVFQNDVMEVEIEGIGVLRNKVIYPR